MLMTAGEVVYRTEDRLGPILVVDYRRHRVLSFGSVFEQSKIDRKRPWLPVHEYNRAMLLPLLWHRPAHATVLGVGGGTLVGALHHLDPQCRQTAVDLRSEVIRVAQDFFSLPSAEPVEIAVGDARVVLEQMEPATTDLILADLYSADRMSPAQSRQLFVELCDRVLSDRGWLVINYHQAPDPQGRLFRHLRRYFASLFLFTSKTNNTVLYASRQPVTLPGPKSTVLKELERRLPIGWAGLVKKVVPVE